MNPKLMSTLFTIAFITCATPLFCSELKYVPSSDQVSYRNSKDQLCGANRSESKLPNPLWLQEKIDQAEKATPTGQDDSEDLANYFSRLTSIGHLRNCPDDELQPSLKALVGILYANVLDLKKELRRTNDRLLHGTSFVDR